VNNEIRRRRVARPAAAEGERSEPHHPDGVRVAPIVGVRPAALTPTYERKAP